MTSGQQRSNTSALSEKEATVNSVADCQMYADFLEKIPALAPCAREVLEEFVTHNACTVHVAAGRTLSPQSQCDQNLYVVVSGSATLDAGAGVRVALEPGDYFGRTPGRHLALVASVTADDDVALLVIGPQDIAQLESASCRHRHPSNIDWRSALANPVTRPARRRRRVLAAREAV
jgi:CRP-like cAMP-binding protein